MPHKRRKNNSFFFREQDEEEDTDDDDFDYAEITIKQLSNNSIHILNTIKNCKQLVKYVKKVFQLYI